MRVLGVDPGLTRCGIGVVEKVGVQAKQAAATQTKHAPITIFVFTMQV
jgi:Holliday junction resolvasome RuvABC endonuclease subunit